MELKLALVAMSLSVLAYGLISNKSESHSVTAPMIFVTFGLLGHILGLAKIDLSHEFIHGFLEITLILVLFSDASRINLRLLIKQHNLPLRMLLIGMPLTILLGGIGAQWLFNFESIWIAFLLAAILAPTDAALGQVVVSSKYVPVRIRQSLNVESGLNDGIALPVILILIALLKTKLGHNVESHGEAVDAAQWIAFSLKQVLLGPLAGITVGFLGGKIISWTAKNKWMNHTYQNLSLISLGFLSFGSAELIGGNGFIAAFCSGLTLGNTATNLCECLYEFAETEGQLLTLSVFLLLGSVILPQINTESLGIITLYAFLSLTIFRILPVSMSLLGSKLKLQSHLFMGWFGPRGLASILFSFLMLKEIHSSATEMLFSVVLVTVFLSIFLHGMTAGPVAKAYGLSVSKKEKHQYEHLDVIEMPVKNKI